MRQDFQYRRLKINSETDKVPVEIKNIACAVLAGGKGYCFIAAFSVTLQKSYVIALSLATLTWGNVL